MVRRQESTGPRTPAAPDMSACMDFSMVFRCIIIIIALHIATTINLIVNHAARQVHTAFC